MECVKFAMTEQILSLSNHITIEKSIETGYSIVEKDTYIVGEKFAVDETGVSYFKNEETNKWEFLCLVVLGNVDEDNVTAKVVFFLNPGVKDTVFMNQIKSKSPKLYEELRTGNWTKKISTA